MIRSQWRPQRLAQKVGFLSGQKCQLHHPALLLQNGLASPILTLSWPSWGPGHLSQPHASAGLTW